MADRVIREWQLKRNGDRFNCRYYSSDVVEVKHETLGRKTMRAGVADPGAIARLLASQLLDRKP